MAEQDVPSVVPLSAADLAIKREIKASRRVSFMFQGGKARHFRALLTEHGKTQMLCDISEDVEDAVWLARRAADEAESLVLVRRGKRGPFTSAQQRPNLALHPENALLDPANAEPLERMPPGFAARLEKFRAYCAMEAARPVNVLSPAKVLPKPRFKCVRANLRKRGLLLWTGLVRLRGKLLSLGQCSTEELAACLADHVASELGLSPPNKDCAELESWRPRLRMLPQYAYDRGPLVRRHRIPGNPGYRHMTSVVPCVQQRTRIQTENQTGHQRQSTRHSLHPK